MPHLQGSQGWEEAPWHLRLSVLARGRDKWGAAPSHPRLPWSEPQPGPRSLGTRRAGTREPKVGAPGLWPGRPWASSSAPLEPSGPSLSGRGRLALGPDSIPCSAFEEEQKRRKQEIVSRLLKEEAMEDRRRARPEPPRPAGQRSLRDQTWSYVATFCDGQSTEAPLCCPLVSGCPGGTGPCLPAKISTTESAWPQYLSSRCLRLMPHPHHQGHGWPRGSLPRQAGGSLPGLWCLTH